MLKKTLIFFVAVLILVAVVGLLLPRNIRVERSVNIERPASLIYATVNSFQLFYKWSPWQSLDPNMRQITEGARDGVGAKLVWSGNDKVGSGTQLITASTPDRSVASDIDFGKMGVAKSTILLDPQNSSTKVTWTLDVDMGASPIGHYFGLMMDHMIGKDYERGLSKLKTLVESMPNVDIAGFVAEPVELSAVPIDRADVTPDGNVRVARSYAGKALKTTHVGPYDTLAKTYGAFRAYMAAHGYIANGTSFSRYVDDPASTTAEKLRTEIYWPIQ
jgi:effector-binding domain-containing protein